MRVGIIGSRSFNDYEMFKSSLKDLNISKIISGGARGADKFAERYAAEFCIPITVHKPDWSIGKIASFIRNKKIVEDSDYIVAFWDGESKGTKMTIDIATSLGLRVIKIIYGNVKL